MTVSGFSGPVCRETRQLLGVYVLGAIDPAERAQVDEHLGECQLCRDELAGLAGLPAMLGHVPVADVERLSALPAGQPEMEEPSDELLNSLLKKVAAKRRSRMWRGAAAAAAAVLVAAGGAAAGGQLVGTHQGKVPSEVATGSNARSNVAAEVDYSATDWGTAMRVQVSGINPGTTCKFWVVQKDGKESLAGSWTVSAGYYQHQSWYQVASQVKPASVRSFQITTGNTNRVLVTIPAS
jgi:anti-sigma factor RsiW